LLLHGRQSVLAPSSITVGLPNPIPDRLGRGFELAPQFFGRPSLPHQFDDALSELRRVRPMALRHRGHSFPPQPWGVHQTGSTPVFTGLAGVLVACGILLFDLSRAAALEPRQALLVMAAGAFLVASY